MMKYFIILIFKTLRLCDLARNKIITKCYSKTSFLKGLIKLVVSDFSSPTKGIPLRLPIPIS